VCGAPETGLELCHTSSGSIRLTPVSCPSDTASFASCATHRIEYMPGSTGCHKLWAKHWKTEQNLCHTSASSIRPTPVSGPSDTVSFASCATHRIEYMPGSTGCHKLCAKHRKPEQNLCHTIASSIRLNCVSYAFISPDSRTPESQAPLPNILSSLPRPLSPLPSSLIPSYMCYRERQKCYMESQKNCPRRHDGQKTQIYNQSRVLVVL
jgi:hypothetical protein